MNKILTSSVLACAMTVGLTGCATENDPNQRAKVGAAVGAVTGALLGHQLDDGAGKWVGAAVGALAGAGVGHYMDNQQQDFETSMSNERAANQLEIERMRDDTLKLTVDSEVSFDFGKADIKPSFRPSLDKLAQLLQKYDRTVVHVVGHTDSVGSGCLQQGPVRTPCTQRRRLSRVVRRAPPAPAHRGTRRSRAACNQRDRGRAPAQPPGRDIRQTDRRGPGTARLRFAALLLRDPSACCRSGPKARMAAHHPALTRLCHHLSNQFREPFDRMFDARIPWVTAVQAHEVAELAGR